MLNTSVLDFDFFLVLKDQAERAYPVSSCIHAVVLVGFIMENLKCLFLNTSGIQAFGFVTVTFRKQEFVCDLLSFILLFILLYYILPLFLLEQFGSSNNPSSFPKLNSLINAQEFCCVEKFLSWFLNTGIPFYPWNQQTETHLSVFGNEEQALTWNTVL